MILPWHVVYRPCGACRGLVDRETGCKHWKPVQAQAITANKRRLREKLNESRRNQRSEDRAMVEEFKNLLGRRAP